MAIVEECTITPLTPVSVTEQSKVKRVDITATTTTSLVAIDPPVFHSARHIASPASGKESLNTLAWFAGVYLSLKLKAFQQQVLLKVCQLC